MNACCVLGGAAWIEGRRRRAARRARGRARKTVRRGRRSEGGASIPLCAPLCSVWTAHHTAPLRPLAGMADGLCHAMHTSHECHDWLVATVAGHSWLARKTPTQLERGRRREVFTQCCHEDRWWQCPCACDLNANSTPATARQALYSPPRAARPADHGPGPRTRYLSPLHPDASIPIWPGGGRARLPGGCHI